MHLHVYHFFFSLSYHHTLRTSLPTPVSTTSPPFLSFSSSSFPLSLLYVPPVLDPLPLVCVRWPTLFVSPVPFALPGNEFRDGTVTRAAFPDDLSVVVSGASPMDIKRVYW
jgi:hypothetical protein